MPDREQIYQLRKESDRSILKQELTMEIANNEINTLLKKSDNCKLKVVSDHENNKASYSITKQSRGYLSEFQIQ